MAPRSGPVKSADGKKAEPAGASPGSLLLAAAKKSDVKAVASLLTQPDVGKFINTAGTDGQTALHIAASLGNRVVVDALISKKASLDLKDAKARVPPTPAPRA